MKKLTYAIFVAIFMLLSMLPFVCMTYYKADTASELRELAPKAQIIKDKKLNTSFGSDFDAYFGDHFAYRSELVDANATLKMKLFNTSAEEKVITGKDGWLFYTETLGDFSGTGRLSDGEIARIAHILKMESDYSKENGKGYIFFVAPNKNTIYPEKMASYYVKSDEKTNLDRLNEKLTEMGVSVLDMKKVLTDAKSEGDEIYYKYDSHWNLRGAMIGYEAIMDAVQKETGYKTAYDGWTMDQLKDGKRIGDLLSMVTPVHAEAFDSFTEGEPVSIFKSKGRPITSNDQMLIETVLKEASEDNMNLLMYRDSFGRSIYKPLANSFNEATFVRANPFTIASMISENSFVVREIVERNINILDDFAAVIPAREIGADKFSEKIEAEIKSMQTEKSGSLVHFYGHATANEKYDDYRATITLSDGTVYEVFPIVESSLKAEDAGTLGFSAYFPSEVDLKDAKVIFFKD